MGLALPKDRRHFIELQTTSDDSYASTLERMYRSFMTEDRLLLRDDGVREKRDTSQRAKLLIHQIKHYGLADLSIGRNNLHWLQGETEIEDIIHHTPDGGEIFVVGRSLVGWADHKRYGELAKAIVCRRIRCILVIADPNKPELESLVKGDYAKDDLERVRDTFSRQMPDEVNAKRIEHHVSEKDMGFFELYGVPAYVPVTFAAYTKEDGAEYCTLEVGIGVTPPERPVLCFQHVNDEDMYSALCRIHRGIISGRTPLVRLPEISE